MQILPSSQRLQQYTDSLTSFSASGATGGQDFSNILASLEQGTASAVSTQTTNLAGVTTLSTTDRSQTTSTSLKVTAEDFAALESDLYSAGLTTEEVEALREQVESDDGVTWQGLMTQVNQTLDTHTTGSTSRRSLTDEELRSLHGLFQKLGFTPTEAKDLLSQFSNGQGDKAWLRIQAKIEALGDTKTITLRSNELSALATLTGLDAQTAQQFAGIFNANGEARLGRDGLQAITMTLRQTAAATHGTLAEEIQDPARQLLNDKLKAALNQALDEAQRDNLASNKETRDVQSQRVNIEDAAARNRRGAELGAGETPDPHAARASIAAATKKADATSQETTSKDAKDATDLARSTDKQTRHSGTAEVESSSSSASKNGFSANTSQDGASTTKDETWRSMWNKVGADAASRSTTSTTSTGTTGTTDPLLAAARAQEALLAAQQQLKTARADAVLQREGVSTEKVLQTVEQGMLRSLREGTKQLTLRLDPPDLGKVTVTLQMSANKELTATLRAENQETAALLNQQLTQLRQSLEQQGLKVDKLDVQTSQTQDQNAATWQGSGQHNQAQEQEARMAEQRTWSFLRRAAARENLLAQDMQSDSAEEVSSQSGRQYRNAQAQGISLFA